ncbi:MAG: hypothetical protein WCI21_04220 [Alphaproteobacteria bacterium]
MSPKSLPACLVLCLAVAALSACGGAYSTRPLYSADDEAAAPPLSEGLWLRSADGDEPCKIDPSLPVGVWPGCAAWTLVRASATWTITLGSDDTGKGAWIWSSTPYIFASGDPRIFQTRAWGDHYYYRAAFNARVGADGALVEYSETPIRCSASPSAPSENGAPPDRTQDDCYFADRASLIQRARKSTADPGSVLTWRWVRAFTAEDQRSVKEKPVPVEEPAGPSPKPGPKPAT